jgi:DNA-binding NtrC family response regulator
MIGGRIKMNSESPINDKKILVVDDEPDILETISELLHMCEVYTAGDYDSALNIILNETFDIVILDIMGVNGFDLLEKSVLRGFETIMLTAHAVNPEALKKSIKLGAAAFLPKEYMKDLEKVIENILLSQGTPLWWRKNLDRESNYLEKEFGQGWKEKDAYFKKMNQDEENGL